MLKSFLLAKKRDLFLAEKTKKEEKLDELKKREDELKGAIDEIDEDTTDEDKKLVEDEVESLVKEMESVKGDITKLEEKIASVKAELDEFEKEVEEAVTEDTKEEPKAEVEDERSKKNKAEIRGGIDMNFEKREKIRKMLEIDENRSFFEDLRDIVLKKRAITQLTNAELLIPETVFTEVITRAEQYGAFLKLVDKISLKGNARINVIDGAAKLVWTECCDPLEETKLVEIKQIEIDCFKLGGYVFICKSFVEDAMIDIANFVMDLFAKAWAEAMDEAIYKGLGADGKQPEGITKVVTKVGEIKNILGLLQTVGELEPYAGNVTAVMNRKTYYKKVLPETYGKDANGKIVYGLGQTLPDGTAIELSDAVADDEVVVGFYKAYKLAIRKEATFDTNDTVKWIEEQIGYKISGRADGRVARAESFKRVKFVEAPAV